MSQSPGRDGPIKTVSISVQFIWLLPWLTNLSAPKTSTEPPINLSKQIKEDPFHPRKRNRLIWWWFIHVLDIRLHLLFTVLQLAPTIQRSDLPAWNPVWYCCEPRPIYDKWGVLFLLCTTIQKLPAGPSAGMASWRWAEAWRWHPVIWCCVPNRWDMWIW